MTVNAVHPGRMAREAVLARPGRVAGEVVRHEVAAWLATRHLVTPDDITCRVAIVCSPAVGAITGQDLAVNGGAGRAVRY